MRSEFNTTIEGLSMTKQQTSVAGEKQHVLVDGIVGGQYLLTFPILVRASLVGRIEHDSTVSGERICNLYPFASFVFVTEWRDFEIVLHISTRQYTHVCIERQTSVPF